MKQILTALFVITASVATAEGEGRYITVMFDDTNGTFLVTDTKLGKVKLCRYYRLDDACDPWRDVTK